MSYLHGYLAGLQWEPATRRREAPGLLVFGFKILPDLIDFMQCWPLTCSLDIRTKCTSMALRFMHSFSCWSQLYTHEYLPTLNSHQCAYQPPTTPPKRCWRQHDFARCTNRRYWNSSHTPKYSSLYCLAKLHSWENEAFPKRVSSKDMVVARDFCHCYCQWAESPSSADLW